MPTHNFKDLTGKPFGRLTVIDQAETKKSGQIYWNCKCRCGKLATIRGSRLRAGITESCGCLAKETTRKRSVTHDMSYGREYAIWGGIIQRCTNPNNQAFKNYGARGITICDEWRHDFMAFFNYVGKRPSPKHSIDRMNNDGNYEPGNVRWATNVEQKNNYRDNHRITLHAHTMTLAQWACFVGLNPNTLIARINKCNWSPAKAIFKPVKHRSK